MSFSANRKTAVLLIEDQQEHAEGVRSVLPPEFYQIEHLFEFSDDELLNYKALHQDNQIVIVDLNLKRKRGGKVDEGLEVIRRYLWPADRTAFFVVFTQYPEKMREVNLGEVSPHWTFVPKALEDDRVTLKSSCLERLRDVVEAYRECCAPVLPSIHYDYGPFLELINAYARDIAVPRRQEVLRQGFGGAIKRSIDLLNDCSAAATPFQRAGLRSADVAIGSYGSCGRLEARPDSDVEYSVFYEGAEGPGPTKDLAVIFWNRLMKHLQAKGVKFEGEALVRGKKPPILEASRVSGDLPNAYCPVLGIQGIIEADLAKTSHVRNRHLQVLTELRAVFNPDVVFSLKRELVRCHVARDVRNVADVVGHGYIAELATQFFLDAKPSELLTPKDYKRFCYRVLHLLTIRLCCIRLVHFVSRSLTTDVEWREFFDALVDPGICKLIKFLRACEEHVPDKDTEKKALIERVSQLIGMYIDMVERLWQMAEDPVDGTPSEWVRQLGAPVRQCIERWVAVVQQIEKMSVFAGVRDFTWLLETGPVVTFGNRIV